MDKKLTLSLNQKIIENAKYYAKSNNISLSKLIENYLNSLTYDESTIAHDSTPLVDSLCGIIELPENFDYRKERGEFLIEKHQ